MASGPPPNAGAQSLLNRWQNKRSAQSRSIERPLSVSQHKPAAVRLGVRADLLGPRGHLVDLSLGLLLFLDQLAVQGLPAVADLGVPLGFQLRGAVRRLLQYPERRGAGLGPLPLGGRAGFSQEVARFGAGLSQDPVGVGDDVLSSGRCGAALFGASVSAAALGLRGTDGFTSASTRRGGGPSLGGGGKPFAITAGLARMTGGGISGTLPRRGGGISGIS